MKKSFVITYLGNKKAPVRSLKPKVNIFIY